MPQGADIASSRTSTGYIPCTDRGAAEEALRQDHRIAQRFRVHERPRVDEEWLEYQLSYHSLDFPLPSILLYFRPGDAVMACFDDECEQWGRETPEPNLIIPFRPDDPASVRQALATVETLMRVLVLTVEVSKLIEGQEKTARSSASMSEANLI